MNKPIMSFTPSIVTRQRYRTILSLILIFLIVSGLLFGIFQGEAARNRLLTRYQLEQAIAQTIAMFRGNLENLDLEDASADLPLQLRAIALYAEDGTPIVRKGPAPPRLLLTENAPDEQLIRHPDIDNLLIYIRQFPSRNRSSARIPAAPPPDQSPPSQRSQPPAVLYLQAHPEPQLQHHLFSWQVLLFFELLLAAALLWIGRVQVSNQRYRHTLEQQRSLVTLGEASRTISH